MDSETRSALWREIVGALEILGVNSYVMYRPRAHFKQSDGICNQKNPQLLEFLPSSVKSVEVNFLEGSGGYPFVWFLLSPREGHRENNLLLNGRVEFGTVEKTILIFTHGGCCQLKKQEASLLFPGDPLKIFLVLMDGRKREFKFKNGKISGGWSSFAD